MKKWLIFVLLLASPSFAADVKDTYDLLNSASELRERRARVWETFGNTDSIIAQAYMRKSIRIQEQMLEEERRHNQFEETHRRYECASDPTCH